MTRDGFAAMNDYQATGVGSLLTFLRSADMDLDFTMNQSASSIATRQPSTQPTSLERDSYHTLNSNNQTPRGVVQPSPIGHARSGSIQARHERHQQADGEPMEKDLERKKTKFKDKRSSLFSFSRLFGTKADQKTMSQDTNASGNVGSALAHHAVAQPSVWGNYALNTSKRHYGQIFDETSNPSREQVVAYIEGRTRTPLLPTALPPSAPRIHHHATMERKSGANRETGQHNASKEEATQPQKRLLCNKSSTHSASSLDRLVSEQRPERRPETYGWKGEHIVLGPSDEELLVVCHVLGHGSLGIVEEVRRKDTQLPTFVRKHVPLSARKAQAKADLRIIQEEAKHLRSFVHPHIVAVIGSYEIQRQANRHSYFLLMSPVGDNDLRNFLDIAGDEVELRPNSNLSLQWGNWIQSWFICLASALDYMHQRGIRHQDIKPSNIIHKGENVFFTDFSSSCAFQVGHTTSTENPSRSSPMYAAPEVTAKYVGGTRRHGRASDVYGLGCVFCEMLNVWQGRSISDFHNYLSNTDGTTYGQLRYSEKIPSIEKRFKASTLFSRCILPMLSVERSARPTAAETLVKIHSLDPWFNISCDCISQPKERGVDKTLNEERSTIA